MQLLSLTLAALSLVGLSAAHLAEPADHAAASLFARQHAAHANVAARAASATSASAAAAPVAARKRFCQPGVDHLIPRDADGNALKRRQLPATSGNGNPYPEPGANPPAPSLLPQAWKDAYDKAKKAGQIPDIPASKEDPNTGLTVYPAGTDLSKVCSWTLSKCNDGDLWLAPRRKLAFGLDDGPTPDGTVPLIKILSDRNISVTHFLIGSAIAWNSDVLKQLNDASPPPHLAIHTWSHTLQTTHSDLEILGDLGWTMQIIYDLTGKIPAYFRPPEGDADARVRAIARVLGLQTVLWTDDADDWCLRQGTGTAKELDTCVQNAPDIDTVTRNELGWVQRQSFKGDNNGTLTLNHETTDQAMKAFGTMLDAAIANKPRWTISGDVASLNGLPAYSNAFHLSDKPTKQDNILPTHDFIELPDGGKGSVNYNLGDWQSLATTGGGTSSGANASSNSRGTSSSTSSTRPTGPSSSSTSGAASVAAPITLLLGVIGMTAALLA